MEFHSITEDGKIDLTNFPMADEFRRFWKVVQETKNISPTELAKVIWKQAIETYTTPRRWKLYWKHKRRGKQATDIVEGLTIQDAFTRAGFGAGAIAALDYYEPYLGGE